jgi:hypothetical protein
MSNSEFVNARGQNLLASSVWAGGQEFLIVAVPGDRPDSGNSTPPTQPIEIVPGLRIKDKKSGQEFKVFSKPIGHLRLVEIQDIHHMQLSRHISEDELRQKFWILSM